MRVGLNLIFLGQSPGGAGRYARELPGALLATDPSTEVHVFVSRDAPADLRSEPWADSARWITVPVSIYGPPVHLLAQYAGLPALAAARRLDVLHSPANTGPVITPGVTSVISLLDLIWLRRPTEWEDNARAHRTMRRLVEHGLRHADRVFAISHAAAYDIAGTLGVPRERIDVTPLGVREPTGMPATSEAALRAELRLGAARVLLCVAQKRPYKNLHRLVNALPELDDDLVLVLPGVPTPHEGELRTLARELGVAERVRFPDWLSDAQLEGLYSLSSAFVLPSLMEGFGLPVLEAMARGLPVACSNIPALREVADDAALLFDPNRQEEVTSAVRRLLEDRELADRLAERGHDRAAQFTWARTGAASLAGYRRAIAARSRRSAG